MSVVIAKPTIVKRWRADEGSFTLSISSKAPVEVLLETVAARVDGLSEAQGPALEAVPPWPTPKGVAVFINYCESKVLLLTFLDEIGAALERVGVEAKIGLLSNDYTPLDNSSHRDHGYTLGMTLLGEPYWISPGDPGRRLPPDRMWDVDPVAQAAVVRHAVDWCTVEGGELWLKSVFSSFKIQPDQAHELVTRHLRGGDWTSLVAARGTDRVRRVGFIENGHVIYDTGGDERPDWQACVAELRDVLVDLHEVIHWGFIENRTDNRYGIGSNSWADMHWALWAAHKSRVPGMRHSLDPRKDQTMVHDVFGIQLLGPGHVLPTLPENWVVETMGSGRRLVSHTDPAAWFSEFPRWGLLLQARADFGELVDPDWSPHST